MDSEDADNGHRPGLLVDYGGVLTQNLSGSFLAFCRAEGLDPRTVGRLIKRDPECHELLVGLETGTLPEEEFEQRLGAKIGVAEPAGMIRRLFAGTYPDAVMQTAVLRARRAGIRTGLLSNSWGTKRYDRGRLAELFDAIVISAEVGLRKPSPEIYELGARRIGLETGQCVFIDDVEANLQPAASLGMATIHHVDAGASIAELERLLGVALR